MTTRRTMMSHIKTEEELDIFNESLNDFWNRFRNITFNEHYSQVVGLRDTYKDSIEALTERLSIKIKEEDQMVEAFLEFRNKIHIHNMLIQEKQDHLSKLVDSIQDKKWEVEKLQKSIQDLKESLDKKKEIISAAKKANKEKLKMLQKSYDLYKDCLGLEIRKIYVSDSAPHLECLAEFQEKIRKSNNFSAFLANVRKAFIALACNECVNSV
ncbi:kinetochore protein Spc25 isoform X3 [Petaurus breviceps papuanus]|uniref:kinetochore protein Spc25 isoform X3 n=1 Tax=Petaurus breviceps papuanus TaxID=3040969 RepID=UPI0036DB9CBB